MKVHFEFLILSVLLIMSNAANSQGLDGDWHAKIKFHDMNLRLVLHVEKVDNGHSLTFDSPDQNDFGIPMDTIIIQGDSFIFKSNKFDIFYSGVASPKKTFIEGVFKQHGDSVIMSFGRYPLMPHKDE